MSENEIYSPEEIKKSVEEAPAFEVIHELAKKSGKESDALLDTGVLLGGGEVVDAILAGQQTKQKEKDDELTL